MIPRSTKHPRVCLHLAYIPPITDFPTPGAPAASAAGSYNRLLLGIQKRCSCSAVQQLPAIWDSGTCAGERQHREAAANGVHHHSARTRLALGLAGEEVEAGEMRFYSTWQTPPALCRGSEVGSSRGVNGKRSQAGGSNLIKRGWGKYEDQRCVPGRKAEHDEGEIPSLVPVWGISFTAFRPITSCTPHNTGARSSGATMFSTWVVSGGQVPC